MDDDQRVITVYETGEGADNNIQVEWDRASGAVRVLPDGQWMQPSGLEVFVESIARICHEANRLYCLGLNDASQPEWKDAPAWQRESAIKGVQARIDNPGAPASASHDSWMQEKLDNGWIYGQEKDPEKKEHPCLVPFRDLPPEQQFKDHLFTGIVDAALGR